MDLLFFDIDLFPYFFKVLYDAIYSVDIHTHNFSDLMLG